MGREKLKSVITSFTPDGDYLAILYPNGKVKIWNTSNGSLLAEWEQPDGSPINYSCMACSFVGKKRKKERGNFLLALGTNDGNLLTIDVFTGETKWKSSRSHPGGIVGLAFANKGHVLLIVGTNGIVYEMNSESGELIREVKASKRSISSASFSCDGKIIAVVSGKTRVLSLEDGKELVKFPDDLGPMQYVSLSNNKDAITSSFGDKHLQVWWSDLSSKSMVSGPTLSMQHSPLVFECKSSSEEKEGDRLAVLAISESGVAYVWSLKSMSQDEVIPTKITVKGNKTISHQQKGESAKKSHTSIFAARSHALEDDGRLKVLIASGSTDSPQFSLVNISNHGEKIVVAAKDEIVTLGENEILLGKDLHELDSEAKLTSPESKKTRKKRAADTDLETTENIADHGEAKDGVLVEDDMNEPTMGEKLASLNLQEKNKMDGDDKQESTLPKPPSADSINVLLKQALRADDHTLLLDCLYTQDEKVIANSISPLSPSDVLKLLHSLVSIAQSRGAVVACALPWIRSLLLQHASGIMSQESSVHALNSLYQLIESRASTYQSALQLSSCIDFLYAGVIDETLEENETIVPVIYEDNDESDDEQESEDAMETDHGSQEEEEIGGISDFEGSDGMSE